MPLTPEEQDELNAINQELGISNAPINQDLFAPPPEDPNSGWASYIGGASKGYLKNAANVLTAPADLLYKGGVGAIDWLTGVPTDPADIQKYTPSNALSATIDLATQNTPSNPTAEMLGGVAGTVGGFIAGPSALPSASKALSAAPFLPRVLGMAGVGGVEGALVNTAMEARQADPNYTRAAELGALGGAVGAGAAPIIGEVADDLSPVLQRTAQGWNESSIGGKVNDFLKSKKQGGAEYDPELGRMQTRLSNSIEAVRQEGTLPKFRNPASTSDAVSTMKEGIGQEIGGIVSQIDAAGIKPNLQLSEVDQFIADAPFTLRADLTAQKNAFVETLKDWDGTASELHRAKSSIGKVAYKSNGVDAKLNKGLQRAIERDLRASIADSLQQGVNNGQLTPDIIPQFTEANKRFGNYANVEEVVTENAIRAQHQADKLGFAVRQIATTGGFGGLAYYGQQTDNPYLKYAGALGVLARTRAGQAAGSAIFRGGAQGAELLSAIGENPYFAQGLMLAALPRTWNDVKGDEAAKQTIAQSMGIDPVQYSSMPEPLQQEIHKQAILLNPNAAEPSPDNLTLINNEYVNPAEKDWVMRNKLDASPAERYKFIGSAWQNKHPGQAGWAQPIAKPQQVPSIGQLNSMLGGIAPTPIPPAPTAKSMVDQLMEATTKHSQDYIQ